MNKIEHMSATVLASEHTAWAGGDEADWRDWESGIPHALLPTMANTAPSGIFALETDLATTEPGALPDADLVDAVVGLERIAAWARARQYALLAEFHRRPGDGSLRAPGTAPDVREWAGDEVAMALQLAPASARARLGDADRLDGALRPTRDLLAAGRIDESRARLVCTMLATLDDPTAAAVQQRVLPRAPEQTWAQLRAALRRAILALDTDGAVDRHRAAARKRRVDVFPDEDGMATLWARLSAVDAASCFTWITRLARGLSPEPGTGVPTAHPGSCPTPGTCGNPGTCRTGTCTTSDTCPAATCTGSGTCAACRESRSLDARRADVLVALLTGRLRMVDPDGGPTTTARPVGADRPLVQITVPITTLTGATDEPAELAGYGPIPAHVAREIAAHPDSTWRRLLTDPATGALLDLGRTTYRPPAGLARFVRARDGSCRHPTCSHPAVGSELDHVIAWQHGGRTAEDNLAALCPRHHDLKEQPGWQVALHPDRTLEWTTPTGHRYRSRPVDHRPTCPPGDPPTPPAGAPPPADPAPF